MTVLPNDAQRCAGLVESLDRTDPALDALWLKEAESRIAGYRAGELEAVDAEEAFAELGQKA